MAGETFKCLNCGHSLGLKRIDHDFINITPCMKGLIKRFTIHRTDTREVEYTITIKCLSCKTNTEVKKIV